VSCEIARGSLRYDDWPSVTNDQLDGFVSLPSFAGPWVPPTTVSTMGPQTTHREVCVLHTLCGAASLLTGTLKSGQIQPKNREDSRCGRYGGRIMCSPTNARSWKINMTLQDMALSGAGKLSLNTAIALPCSGAGSGMWRYLHDHLNGQVRLLTPDLYGAADGPIWPGERAFSLDDEVAPIVQAIDGCDRGVHLIGHSYGAAVALHAALARPEKVSSLTLYEPAAFQVLRIADGVEYAEITGLARDVEVMLARGDVRGSMTRFVNFWGGAGSWDAMTPNAQAALMRWAPKASLDFRAVLAQSVQPSRYESLRMPCLIISGEQSPDPIREIAKILYTIMPDCQLKVLEGIGHMGPFTHGSHTAKIIADHIQSVARDADELSAQRRGGHAA
jgi:pimeloyl-ACP methyl ester carboxylesterase